MPTLVDDEIVNEEKVKKLIQRKSLLTNDVMFKMFFKEATDVIIDLVYDFIGIKITKEDITFIDKELNGETLDDKNSVVDLLIELPSKDCILFEMQKAKDSDFFNRMFDYSIKLSAKSAKIGKKYKKITKVYTIIFIAKDHEEFKYPFTKGLLYDIVNTRELSDRLVFEVINLSRLDENLFSEKVNKFLKFMASKSVEEMKDMALTDEEYKTYMDLQEKIAADDHYRMALIREENRIAREESIKEQEAREQREKMEAEAKAQREKMEAEAKAQQEKMEAEAKAQREKVLAEGLEKGLAEGQRKIVVNMQKANMSIEVIKTVTGLTEKEINDLIKEA